MYDQPAAVLLFVLAVAVPAAVVLKTVLSALAKTSPEALDAAIERHPAKGTRVIIPGPDAVDGEGCDCAWCREVTA